MATQLLNHWLTELQNELDLEIRDIAGAVNVPMRTVVRWQRGQTFPQRETRRALDDLYCLEHEIYDSIGRGKSARSWLHSPSAYLGGLKPVDAVRAGRLDAVREAIAAMDHGFFT